MVTDKHIALSETSENERRLVQDQLKVILASTCFNSAKQMQRFLEYVVDKTLASEGNLLKQYTIGVEALGLPDAFDSDSNPIVRIIAGRVRSRLREFYKKTDSYKIIIDIPKGTYTPLFINDGSKINDFRVEPETENEKLEISSGPSIALLSFSDKSQSELGNRLILRATDILATELSKFILAKFIVFNPISDRNESYKLHQEINTEYKLNLYIQERKSKKHELLCRLTDFDGQVKWSESYSINADQPLADQDEIFSKLLTMVVDIHQGKVHMDWARRLLVNKEGIPKKFQAVVYYRQFYDSLNIETFTEAVKACESALHRNSEDIIANILLSDLCRRDYIHGFNLIESPIEKGVKYAERVIHLRQDSHEAYYTLGQILFSQGNLDRSLDAFVLARTLNHFSAAMDYGCGFHFCLMGKWEEGLALVKKSMGMSSNYPSWYHVIISLSFYRKGRYQEALTEAKKIVAPGVAHGRIVRCIAYAQLGDIENAKKELKEIIQAMPNLKKGGPSLLRRTFGDEVLTKKIWEGLEIAIKG